MWRSPHNGWSSHSNGLFGRTFKVLSEKILRSVCNLDGEHFVFLLLPSILTTLLTAESPRSVRHTRPVLNS